MKPFTFVSLLGFLLLAGCLTPVSDAPRSVTIPKDLSFSATPPIGFPTRQFTISQGRYTFWQQDAAAFYYTREGAMVSRSAPGEAPEKVSGGLGLDRSNNHFFVWKHDVTSGAGVMTPALTIVGKAGRPIQTFLAGLPKDLEATLVIER